VNIRGNRVAPSPCLWGRQPLPTAVGTWGNRFPQLPPYCEHTGKPGCPIPLPVGAPAALNSGWDMGKPGFPNPLRTVNIRGNRVSPSPCLWGRQPLPTAVGTWGNRVSPRPCPSVCRATPPVSWGIGKPGFPTPLLAGRVRSVSPPSRGARFLPPLEERPTTPEFPLFTAVGAKCS